MFVSLEKPTALDLHFCMAMSQEADGLLMPGLMVIFETKCEEECLVCSLS